MVYIITYIYHTILITHTPIYTSTSLLISPFSTLTPYITGPAGPPQLGQDRAGNAGAELETM